MNDSKAGIVDLAGRFDGRRIAVERDEPAARGEHPKDAAAVPAAAERAVHVKAVRIGHERARRFGAQH